MQLAEMHQQLEMHSAGVERLQASLGDLAAMQAGALEDMQETGRALERLHGSTSTLQQSLAESERVQQQLLRAEELLSHRMASLHSDQNEHASKASAAWQVQSLKVEDAREENCFGGDYCWMSCNDWLCDVGMEIADMDPEFTLIRFLP